MLSARSQSDLVQARIGCGLRGAVALYPKVRRQERAGKGKGMGLKVNGHPEKAKRRP